MHRCRIFISAARPKLMGGLRPHVFGDLDRPDSADGRTSRRPGPLPASGRVPPRLVTCLDAGSGETATVPTNDPRVWLLAVTSDPTFYLTQPQQRRPYPKTHKVHLDHANLHLPTLASGSLRDKRFPYLDPITSPKFSPTLHPPFTAKNTDANIFQQPHSSYNTILTEHVNSKFVLLKESREHLSLLLYDYRSQLTAYPIPIFT